MNGLVLISHWGGIWSLQSVQRLSNPLLLKPLNNYPTRTLTSPSSAHRRDLWWTSRGSLMGGCPVVWGCVQQWGRVLHDNHDNDTISYMHIHDCMRPSQLLAAWWGEGEQWGVHNNDDNDDKDTCMTPQGRPGFQTRSAWKHCLSPQKICTIQKSAELEGISWKNFEFSWDHCIYIPSMAGSIWRRPTKGLRSIHSPNLFLICTGCARDWIKKFSCETFCQ